MQAIRDFFDRSFVQSDADWKLFSSKLVQQDFSKKSRLLKSGQTEQYLSFIERGIIRYFIPGEERDVTFAFAFDGEFTSAYDSFITQSPAGYEAETIIPTTLWGISHADLQEIYRYTESGNQIGRLAAEGLFIRKARRELALLTLTAKERYLSLLAEKPHLLRAIPLKYLASYIGVTPQALSRIRARIS